MEIITFPVKSITTSGLLILMHGVISLPDTTLWDIMLYLGSIGMECVMSESCHKGTIFQRNFRKMTINW